MKIFVELRTRELDSPDSDHPPETGSPKIAITAPKAVVAFASARGGTGKSTLAVSFAAALALGGRKIGLLDADLNAPSIPAMLGIKPFQMLPMIGGIEPAAGPLGLRVIASSLMPEGEPAPFSFAGGEPEAAAPQPTGLIELDYSDSLVKIAGQIRFGTIDLVFIDLAPGLEHLYRASRLLELNGVILVNHPGEQAARSTRAALEITAHLSTPVIGVIENMAGFNCDNCHSVRPLFPQRRAGDAVSGFEVNLLGRLPFDPRLTECAERGALLVKDYPDVPLAKRITETAGRIQQAVLRQAGSAEQTAILQS